MMNNDNGPGVTSSDEESVHASEADRDKKQVKSYAEIVVKCTNYYTSQCNLENKRSQYSGFDKTYRTHLSHFFPGRERANPSMENA